jgi:hypothetical protein
MALRTPKTPKTKISIFVIFIWLITTALNPAKEPQKTCSKRRREYITVRTADTMVNQYRILPPDIKRIFAASIIKSFEKNPAKNGNPASANEATNILI